MEEPQNNVSGDEDLGNYITQVVTDIGTSCISTDMVSKLKKVSINRTELENKKLRCKMASVSNQAGVPAAEYSSFAVHVYKYLSYIKDIDVPTLEDLQLDGKMVDIKPSGDNSKYYYYYEPRT